MRRFEQLVAAWALGGGLLLLCVVAVNGASAIGAAFGSPIAGDVELTEMGVAIAIFMFLPLCQTTGSNVVAEIFSARFPHWLSIALTRIWSLGVAFIASILLWRMSLGMLDYKQYGYTTSILQLPHWIAYLPILTSLFLLVLSGLLGVWKEPEDQGIA